MAVSRFPNLCAVRTWKRDGSRNLMTVEAAVKNLTRSCPKNRAHVLDVMLLGEVFETPLASFRLMPLDEARVLLAA